MLVRRFLIPAALSALLPLAAATAMPAYPPIGGRGGAGMAVLRPCASASLRAAVTSDTGAMLHRELRVTLTNAGTTACAISGYAAVRILDERRRPFIVAETFSIERPREFTIGPNQRAAFGLRIATGDGTTSYMTAPLLAIIPPGDVVPLYVRVTLPVAPSVDITALRPAADYP